MSFRMRSVPSISRWARPRRASRSHRPAGGPVWPVGRWGPREPHGETGPPFPVLTIGQAGQALVWQAPVAPAGPRSGAG